MGKHIVGRTVVFGKLSTPTALHIFLSYIVWLMHIQHKPAATKLIGKKFSQR